MDKIKRIVVGFDLDDTLYSRARALNIAFESLGIGDGLDFEAFQKQFIISSEIAVDMNINGNLTLEESRVYRVKHSLESFGIFIDEDEHARFQEVYIEAQNNIVLNDGMKELLDSLKSKGITMFILTNGPTEHQNNKIDNLGIREYFDEIFISGEINTLKPDKRIFDLVADKYMDSEIYYLGDSFENDIVGSVNSKRFKPLMFAPDTLDDEIRRYVNENGVVVFSNGYEVKEYFDNMLR